MIKLMLKVKKDKIVNDVVKIRSYENDTQTAL